MGRTKREKTRPIGHRKTRILQTPPDTPLAKLGWSMNKTITLLLIAWTTLGSSVVTAEEELPPLTAFIGQLAREAIESKKAVGLNIGVSRGDKILFAQGFGLANVELHVPATKDTVYRIGSVTKEFTAAAVLLLVEEGKIDLDAPLTTYLPEYPEQGKTVTVRHLLRHTSGVKDFTRLPNYRKERPLDVTQQQVLERFQDLQLEFPPGEKHRYCNSGYFLLAMIVEKASGKPFPEFIEEHLFQKLGMKQSYCDHGRRIIPNRASGYTQWGGHLRNAPYISLNQTVGAGNLALTVGDLIKWQQGLMSHRLLKKEQLELMTARGQLNNGKPFNYGFGVRLGTLDKHPVIRHGGGISGFRADLAYYPESHLTIVVLANNDSLNTKRLSDQIARFLLRREKPMEQ